MNLNYVARFLIPLQFSTVGNIVFPSVHQTFLRGVKILNSDLRWVLSAECIIDTVINDQLILLTWIVFATMIGQAEVVCVVGSLRSNESTGGMKTEKNTPNR